MRASVTRRVPTVAWLAIACAIAGCAAASSAPVAIDTAHDVCGSCRMVVSNVRFASEIVAPYEDPKFFDDLGCLARYLATATSLPAGARVFVADHHTGAWIAADAALYARVASLTAPMGSHLVAYASAESRAADADAAAGMPVTAAAAFDGHLPRSTP